MSDTIKKYLIADSITVKEALKQMGEVGEKILFVVGTNGALLGTVTDGDIRRWILKEGNLTAKVKEIYNKSPRSVRGNYEIHYVKHLMLKEKIESLPVIDDEGQLIDVLLWNNISLTFFFRLRFAANPAKSIFNLLHLLCFDWIELKPICDSYFKPLVTFVLPARFSFNEQIRPTIPIEI